MPAKRPPPLLSPAQARSRASIARQRRALPRLWTRYAGGGQGRGNRASRDPTAASGRRSAPARRAAVDPVSRLLCFVVEARRRLRRQPAALARQGVAAGELPVAGGGSARERLPAVGP